MKSLFLVAAAFLAQTALARAEDAVDPSTFLIARDQLATQESDPFMLAGRVMDESQPRWKQFEDTLAAFPDTSTCLLPEERRKDVQNLLAFDWKAMRYLTEIDVCVWRIATTLDDIERMRDWIAAQGFKGSYNRQSCNNAVRTPITTLRSPYCAVGGVMSIEDFDARTSTFDNMSFLTRWFWRGIAQRASITVSYDYNLHVNDSSSGIISQ